MADTILKNVISFSVTVDQEVDQDFISITFSAVERGYDANSVQDTLATRLKDALDIARPKEVDDQVEVRSGNFQINPTYDKDGAINGYEGRTYMIVSGIDTKTILSLTGEIKTMTVDNVQQSISKDLRKSVEQCLAVRAIKEWREKSKTYADAFNVSSFSLVNADISVSNYFPPYTRYYGPEMAKSGEITAEPGKETLNATVTGTVQLTQY